MDKLMEMITKGREDERKKKDEEHAHNLKQLQEGGILFYNNSPGYHTYMYLGKLYGVDHCRVHARSGEKDPYGVYIEEMPGEIKYSTAFVCQSIDLSKRAMTYLTSWAKIDSEMVKKWSIKKKFGKILEKDTKKKLVGFSAGRYKKLVDPEDNAPLFTGKSLWRALKYASRTEAPMSGKGTTCTALLVSAYQAAVFSLLTGSNYDKIKKALEVLGEHKDELDNFEEKINKKEKIDKRVGSADWAWEKVRETLVPEGKEETKLVDVMPSSLLLDAKTVRAGKPWKSLVLKDTETWKKVLLKGPFMNI